jgi:hypothetical protein
MSWLLYPSVLPWHSVAFSHFVRPVSVKIEDLHFLFLDHARPMYTWWGKIAAKNPMTNYRCHFILWPLGKIPSQLFHWNLWNYLSVQWCARCLLRLLGRSDWWNKLGAMYLKMCLEVYKHIYAHVVFLNDVLSKKHSTFWRSLLLFRQSTAKFKTG